MDCPRCGGDIQEQTAAFCPHCGSRLFAGPEGRAPRPPAGESPDGTTPPGVPPLAPPPPGEGPRAETPEEKIPFEDPALPFPSRLLGTIRAVLFRPGNFFSRLAPGGLGLPLLYGLILGVIGWIFWGLWYPPTRDWALEAARDMPAEMQGGLLAEMLENALTDAEVRAWVLLSPLITLVTIFLAAGLIHLTLVLLGGGERGLRVTLRAVCYGSTPALLMIVPFCGQYLVSIWSLVLVAVGLARGHRCAGWQAAFAVIVPVFFSCCLFVGLNILAVLRGGGLGG